MDRLTRRLESGTADCAYCTNEFAENKYTENGNSYCSGECELKQAQLEKLARYEDLEERGLLVKLPCRIGEYVYVIDEKSKQYGNTCTIYSGCELFELDTEDDCPISKSVCKKFCEGCPRVVMPIKVEALEMFQGEMCPCTSSHYGENIPIENYYPTKEAAEKALAEMEK